MFRSRLWTGSRNPEAEFSLLANATYTGIDDTIDAPAVHIIGNSLDIIVCACYSHRSTHSHRRMAALERSMPPPAGLQQRGLIVSDTCLFGASRILAT
jgi:hypothetical protein